MLPAESNRSKPDYVQLEEHIYFVPTARAVMEALTNAGGWFSFNAPAYMRANPFEGPAILTIYPERATGPWIETVAVAKYHATVEAEIERYKTLIEQLRTLQTTIPFKLQAAGHPQDIPTVPMRD